GLFYWWPIWLFGLILGIVSMASGERLAIVPKDTKPAVLTEYTQKTAKTTDHFPPDDKKDGDKATVALLYPQVIKPDADAIEKATKDAPSLGIAKDKNWGVLFAILLLLVIVVTSGP